MVLTILHNHLVRDGGAETMSLFGANHQTHSPEVNGLTPRKRKFS